MFWFLNRTQLHFKSENILSTDAYENKVKHVPIEHFRYMEILKWNMKIWVWFTYIIYYCFSCVFIIKGLL